MSPPVPEVAAPKPPAIAVLIATKGRRELLQSRALASVARQTRPPEYLVIVEDTADVARPSTRRVARRRDFPDVRFLIGRNVRTPGVSGAWNTGLERLLAAGADPRSTYVAILDDDDAYEPDHLFRCLRKARSRNLDLVAAPLLRHESVSGAPLIQKSPKEMSAAEFLVRSQHLQGSNLFVRLATLLEAGGFDEGQMSVTDRDVCIRLSDLPKLRYSRLRTPTVHHHAEPERERMSTPRSPTRCLGLIGFHQKWGSRMSPEQQKSSRGRARRLFAWTDPPGPFDVRFDAPPAVHGAQSATPLSHLVVASAVRASHAARAAEWLRWVKRAGAATRVEAIWLAAEGGLAEVAATLRDEGIACAVVDRSSESTAAQLATEVVRRTTPTATAWFASDDLRPGARFATRVGESVFEYDLTARLAMLRDRGVTAARGEITGDSLEPPEFACRIELHDAFHNLLWLAKCDPSAALADRGAENAAMRRGRQAWYVDGSMQESDRIERPCWLTPAEPGETVRAAVHRVAREFPDVARGHRLFRPMVVDRATRPRSLDGEPHSNLVVFDLASLRARSLRDVAAIAADDGPPVHRVVDPVAPAPDLERAARWIVDSSLAAADGCRGRRFAREWRERLVRLELGFHRTRGLARALFRRARPDGTPWAWWWKDDADRAAMVVVRDAARGFRDRFSHDCVARLRETVAAGAARVASDE